MPFYEIKYGEIFVGDVIKHIDSIKFSHAEYLEEWLKHLSFNMSNHDIKIKYLMEDHKIDCNIDEENIILICK